MHLDLEQIQRLVDDELSAPELRRTRAHLDVCAECRSRTAEAERDSAELERALRLLDHALPEVTVSDIARAGAGERRLRGIRWAATVALVAGLGGVAYAAPGSPLRSWMAGLVQQLDGEPRKPAPARPAPQGVGTAEFAGIAVPAGERLVVSFARTQARGVAVVTIVPRASEVTLRAPSGAATFVAGPDSLTVENRDSAADFAIEIPAGAPLVEIRVAGEPIFRKEGSRVTARGTPPGSSGPYRLPLGP